MPEWKIKKEVLRVETPIFDVVKTEKENPNGKIGHFVSIDAPNWVSSIVFNRDTNKWMMVREFRHGINKYIYEFPSGTVEENETQEDAIIRELKEELGVTNVSIIEKLFEGCPNVAMFNNKWTFFYCEVSGKDKQKLDKFEDVEPVEMRLNEIEEAFKNMGIECTIAQQFAWYIFSHR